MWDFFLIHALKDFIIRGKLSLRFANGSVREFGDENSEPITASLLDKDLPRKLLVNPDLALGEAYKNGTLVIENDDLFGFLKILAINAKEQKKHWLTKIVKFRQSAFRNFIQRNKIN